MVAQAITPLSILIGALTALFVAVSVAALWDMTQKRHAIRRNFPLIGRLRYILEGIGPELRQYIVTSDREERPYSRGERRWVYATAKGDNSLFGFGTNVDYDHQAAGHIVFAHAPFPVSPPPEGITTPPAKVWGAPRQRALPWRPDSITYISAMSYGALSGAAVRALNKGAATARVAHNVGEGGLSPHHLHGADLIFQIGTGYFGCRDGQGRFDLGKLGAVCDEHPQIKAIEIKLSQGAKPGGGGLLPGTKVTADIAAARGVPIGVDCASPATHTAFSSAEELVEFIETVAERTGRPVTIKSAVGQLSFWERLAKVIELTGNGPDGIVIDGGEGGTGAAPLHLADQVGLPFRTAFPAVWRIFAEHNLTDDIVWVGSGRLGLPGNAAVAFALGADMVATARSPMLAIGCIHSLRCHTDSCPAGVATQNRWLERGLHVEDKAVRAATWLQAFDREIARLAGVMGHDHPGLIGVEDLMVLDDRHQAISGAELFNYKPGWGMPPDAGVREAVALRDALIRTTLRHPVSATPVRVRRRLHPRS